MSKKSPAGSRQAGLEVAGDWDEALRAWERDIKRYGVPGLRATRVQIYRQDEER